MSNSQIKPIKINPELFTIAPRSGRNKTIKRSTSNNIKPNNLKRELLAKIKNHRTTKLGIKNTEQLSNEEAQKPSLVEDSTNYQQASSLTSLSSRSPAIKENIKTSISLVKDTKGHTHNEMDDDFSQSIDFLKGLSEKKKRREKKDEDIFPISSVLPDTIKTTLGSTPPYSCLKNSILPTYRQLYNKTLKNDSEIVDTSSEAPPISFINNKNMTNKNTTIKYNLGKKGRYVGVLVKNAETRKRVSNEHNKLKETKLTDMKNYLKRHNLLKTGSLAPPDVIKKLYEQSLLGGDIRNANKTAIVHNYLAE